jgi:hypothetical protein
LYASEEEKVNIDEKGTLTITGGAQATEEDMLEEEKLND